MVQMREENIIPVLVLNKVDLGFDQQKWKNKYGTLPGRFRCFTRVFTSLGRFLV